ncbi:MAG: class I SAM-dependent methyltransferase [Actinobacteria bacterium]|nr:class I SAM-dependent methyltransferase [Actinomycetota bacterium]
MSLALVDAIQPAPNAAIIDVGGGASSLAGTLLARRFDVTVLDVSPVALDHLAPRVRRIVADVREWVPDRSYAVWHDRAAFHFLTERADRERYVNAAHRAVRPGGNVIVGAFAPDGPTRCSGLPVARYDAEGLAAEFGAHFALVDARREEHVTPSGSVQPFTWIVLESAAS